MLADTLRHKILLISPQPWDHIRISKHNYAITLAHGGHEVVFMNPPVAGLTARSQLEVAPGYDGLKILSYRSTWFARIRFHMAPVFDWLMARYVKRMLHQHRLQPDLVWCFDHNLFPDLSVFGAAIRIYHPVDPLSELRHLQPAKSADLLLTVSDRIAEQLAPAGKPVEVINHGLAAPFEELAKSRQTKLKHMRDQQSQDLRRDGRVQVGYAGNLGRRPVNRDVLSRIVQQNVQADFHFWGPADAESEEIAEFIALLSRQSNVNLHGTVSQTQLADGFCRMDLFLLSYNADPLESDRSNSHKLLEYLSSGRVVVSSRIQAYEKTQDLLVMSESETDEDLPQRFAETLTRLTELNSVQLQLARIALALDNTYKRQIDRIFKLLSSSKS